MSTKEEEEELYYPLFAIITITGFNFEIVEVESQLK